MSLNKCLRERTSGQACRQFSKPFTGVTFCHRSWSADWIIEATFTETFWHDLERTS